MNLKRMKPLSLAITLLLGLPLAAGALSITATSSPGIVIPDGDLNGVADTINLSTAINSITDVQVTLDITGGYNGDYYAYLRHSDASGVGFAVLLNRVGVTGGNPYGSPDSGFNITFSDSAGLNIHSASAGGGVLAGTFQPDGRNVSPFTDPAVLAATTSTAILNSFNGMDASGNWTLFIADVSPVGMGTLESWGVSIDGQTLGAAVADGGSTLGLLALALLGLFIGGRKLGEGNPTSNGKPSC